MQNIVITGGGSGLGKALAHLYAKRGFRVYLLGRRASILKKAADDICFEGGNVSYFVCDVSDKCSINQWIDYIKLHQITFKTLINAAGVGYFGTLETLTDKAIEEMIATNLLGTIRMSKAMIPYVEDQVMNIVSTAGLRGKGNESVYCASKFGVRGFTESMCLEQNNLLFTAVYMGGMDTPFWEGTEHITDKSRLKSPNDVAEEILRLNDGRTHIEL